MLLPKQSMIQKARVWLKKQVLCRFFGPIPSFCKHCGREVRDFSVDDAVWDQVDPHIKAGHVLCYDCFCDYCDALGLYGGCWELKGVE